MFEFLEQKQPVAVDIHYFVGVCYLLVVKKTTLMHSMSTVFVFI